MTRLLASASLFLMACTQPGPSNVQIIGTWSSEEGYSVRLSPDLTYRFCDRDRCFTDRYERPGSPAGIAVTLKNVFRHPEAQRFHERLRGMTPRGGIFDQDYPDLDFTVNAGVGEVSAAAEACGDQPCIFFGQITTDNNLHFVWMAANSGVPSENTIP